VSNDEDNISKSELNMSNQSRIVISDHHL